MEVIEVKTLDKFIERWQALPEPRQCFCDPNGVATLWCGDQNRFGDAPGRSFGPEHVKNRLKTGQKGQKEEL